MLTLRRMIWGTKDKPEQLTMLGYLLKICFSWSQQQKEKLLGIYFNPWGTTLQGIHYRRFVVAFNK